MFTYLKVKNFALIDDVEIEFKKGFTAFVGETGAGKSLLVDAIDLLSGARSSASFVQKDMDFALIQGSFYLNPEHLVLEILAKEDITIEAGEELLVQRQIMADGRTICKIHGVKVQTAFLKEIMQNLVDIHGQHENGTLLNHKNHLKLLDNFGVSQTVLETYQQEFSVYQQLLAEQQQLKKLYDEIEHISTFEKQIFELEKANVKLEEVKEIDLRLFELRNFNRNFETLAEITSIFEQTKVVEHLYQLQQLFQTLNNEDAQNQAKTERVTNAYYELQDIETEVSQQIATYMEQKLEQEKLEQRISDIFTLQKKYGDDLDEALSSLKEKVATLQNIEFEYIQLDKKITKQHEQLVLAANMLHKQREQVAEILAAEIMQQLADLYMSHVEFKVYFEAKPISSNGIDDITFFIKTNIGTDFQPLNKIASGGELSRIMLAIKIVFAKNQTLSTIIFDEIDTGVSGAVAEAIAKKMRVFSEVQQVFAITHLPQVLAASNHQLLIEKYVADNKTHVQLKYLTTEGHEIEVAKMLSGATLNDIGREHASNLIASFNE